MEYIAGGATQNSARVAQWMLQVGGSMGCCQRHGCPVAVPRCEACAALLSCLRVCANRSGAAYISASPRPVPGGRSRHAQPACHKPVAALPA